MFDPKKLSNKRKAPVKPDSDSEEGSGNESAASPQGSVADRTRTADKRKPEKLKVAAAKKPRVI